MTTFRGMLAEGHSCFKMRCAWLSFAMYLTPLRPIPTRRLTPTPTGRQVGGEISNMFDISRRSPFSRRRRSPGDQLPSCPLNRPYPQGDRRYNRLYNRPSSADCSADCSADRQVGMALYAMLKPYSKLCK